MCFYIPEVLEQNVVDRQRSIFFAVKTQHNAVLFVAQSRLSLILPSGLNRYIFITQLHKDSNLIGFLSWLIGATTEPNTDGTTGAGGNLISRADESPEERFISIFFTSWCLSSLADDNHCKLTCRCKGNDNHTYGRTSALDFAVVSVWCLPV